MTGAAKCLLHRGMGPAQHERRCPHAAGDDDRLANPGDIQRDVWCIRPECAGSTLAVHTHHRVFSLIMVLFHLGNIMGHIVYQRHLVVIHCKHFRQHGPCSVRDHLPVGPCIVCRCSHGPEIGLSFRGEDRCAGKLPVREGNLIFPGRLLENFQMVGAHLVAEAPGTTVDHAADLPGSEPESVCCFRIIDLADNLQFEKMVARAQCTPLGHSPLFCLG